MAANTFTLSFECNNEVFADYVNDAIADALLAVSKHVRHERLAPNEAQWVRDNNGNRIGTWKLDRRRVSHLHG
jgi:hypothetical protein